MSDYSAVCVDASLVMRLVVGGPGEEETAKLWKGWAEVGTRILAPALLAYECVNALRQLERTHIITRNAADAALAAIQRLGVELLDDPALHRRALELCRELGLSSAYDAHYLALAERTRTPLFTADGRLASKVGRRFADLHLVA